MAVGSTVLILAGLAAFEAWEGFEHSRATYQAPPLPRERIGYLITEGRGNDWSIEATCRSQGPPAVGGEFERFIQAKTAGGRGRVVEPPVTEKLTDGWYKTVVKLEGADWRGRGGQRALRPKP